jgi:putative flavoprotein involved in K+ transport
MTRIDTAVIGAGHAGLAVSRLLTLADHDHVVLERGELGQRWRTERWDSLRLLSPNWMARLPGWVYTGPDQEGYMTVDGFIGYLERYASSFDAPVLGGTAVERVEAHPSGEGYVVSTSSGTWAATNVVVAAGPWARPVVPEGIELPGPDPFGHLAPGGRSRGASAASRQHRSRHGRSAEIEVLASSSYRNPDQLPDGGVLVVGASSSGVQIADELARSGRRVVLAVGRHTRMPRRYRGMDVYWWLERTGRFAQTIDQVADTDAARSEPSLQLVGHGPGVARADIDLTSLQTLGVQLTGRLEHLDSHGRARFRDDLADNVQQSEQRLHKFLDRVDRHVEDTHLGDEVWSASRPDAVRLPRAPHRLDLVSEGIGSVILAAGYRPDHSWLNVPVVGADGQIQQRCGVTAAPGLYVVGQRFQYRRDSATIDGARHDARAVVGHLLARDHTPASVATTDGGSTTDTKETP